jgi:hypothetical protein
MANDHFIIEIPCKPYVKAYIEFNCGVPADLFQLPLLICELKRGLKRKNSHREEETLSRCTDIVKVIIPNDLFYRCGWEMNKESQMDFNRIAEMQVKFMMRQYISLNHAMGATFTESIRSFQEQFGFSDTVWSFDSIKKDFYRNGGEVKYRTVKILREEMNNIFMAEMSRLGTIGRRFKKQNVYG